MKSREWILENAPRNAAGVSAIMGFRDGAGPRCLRICAHCDKADGLRAYGYAMEHGCGVTHGICSPHFAEVTGEQKKTETAWPENCGPACVWPYCTRQKCVCGSPIPA